MEFAPWRLRNQRQDADDSNARAGCCRTLPVIGTHMTSDAKGARVTAA
jgi:hypothetical protein